MSETTTPTALRAVPTYCTQLDRLATLLPPLAEVFEAIATDSDSEKLDKSFAAVERAFGASDEHPLMGASREAADIALRLSVSQHLREYANRPHPAADVLIRTVSERRIKPGPDLDDFIRNLPWLMATALQMLASSRCVQDRPTSKEAIAARMFAAIMESVQKIEGLRHSAPEDQH